jgi:hypothetical protein
VEDPLWRAAYNSALGRLLSRSVVGIWSRLHRLCPTDIRCASRFSCSDSGMPVQQEHLLDGLLRKRRSTDYFAFGSRYLKTGNGSFRYSCPFLLCKRGEHRNHHVLERSS